MAASLSATAASKKQNAQTASSSSELFPVPAPGGKKGRKQTPAASNATSVVPAAKTETVPDFVDVQARARELRGRTVMDQSLAASGQHPAPSGQHPAPSAQHPTPSAQHPAPSGQPPVASGQQPVPSAQPPVAGVQVPDTSAPSPHGGDEPSDDEGPNGDNASIIIDDEPSPSVAGSFQLSNGQFRELVDSVRQPTVVLQERENQRVSWTGLHTLVLTDTSRLDAWFVTFETNMKASWIPEKFWVKKFLECPHVSEGIKAQSQTLIDKSPNVTYSQLWTFFMKQYGPKCACEYYRSQIRKIKGTFAEDIRDRMTQLMVLHNRSRVLENYESVFLTTDHLCYDFVEAFPEETQKQLRVELRHCFSQPDAFHYLMTKAPSMPEESKNTEERLAKLCAAASDEDMISTLR